jgi:hypothetical protein
VTSLVQGLDLAKDMQAVELACRAAKGKSPTEAEALAWIDSDAGLRWTIAFMLRKRHRRLTDGQIDNIVQRVGGDALRRARDDASRAASRRALLNAGHAV